MVEKQRYSFKSIIVSTVRKKKLPKLGKRG